MASKTMEIAIALASFAIILISTPPSTIVAQFDDCGSQIGSLSPCFGYIEQRDEFPPPNCCYSLEDVVQSQPDCLCEVLRGDEGVNRTRLLELPYACSVQTPAFGNCYYDDTPPFFSGYSTKLLNPLLVSVLTTASCAHVLFINA